MNPRASQAPGEGGVADTPVHLEFSPHAALPRPIGSIRAQSWGPCPLYLHQRHGKDEAGWGGGAVGENQPQHRNHKFSWQNTLRFAFSHCIHQRIHRTSSCGWNNLPCPMPTSVQPCAWLTVSFQHRWFGPWGWGLLGSLSFPKIRLSGCFHPPPPPPPPPLVSEFSTTYNGTRAHDVSSCIAACLNDEGASILVCITGPEKNNVDAYFLFARMYRVRMGMHVQMLLIGGSISCL